MIPGLDVWSGYGVIDWQKVADAGYRFVWVKCTQGNDPAKDDAAFARNVEGAMKAGLAVGAYLFLYPLPIQRSDDGRSPLEQVARFARISKLLGSRPGELSPMIDWEWPPPQDWPKWGCTPEQVSESAREACEAVTLQWSRLPVVYTYPWFEGRIGTADDEWAGRYPLAMAAYTSPGPGVPAVGRRPPVPPPWNDWAVWQHSADGSSVRVPGVPACPVDRDVIKDEATFLRLTGREDAPPPTIRDSAVVYAMPEPVKPPDDAA